jgi:ferredoxin--NADP+ reductase
MAQWLDAKVVKRIDWNDHLFSLTCSCADFPGFTPGQFTKFGVMRDGKIISRPYSLVNSSNNPELEIVAVPVADGVLSPDLHAMQPGDDIKVMAPATGFLVLDEVPDSQNLWLLATGTGVGPFLSILSGADPWQRFDKITLVYGVRHANDLAYLNNIHHWLEQYPQRFSFIPVVSREPMQGALRGRIPALLQSGQIQQQSQQSLNATDSQVMLCGNPQMITSALEVLTDMGLKKHLRRSPGQISMERYW